LPGLLRGRADLAPQRTVSRQRLVALAEGQEQIAFDELESGKRNALAFGTEKLQTFLGLLPAQLDGSVLAAGDLQILQKGFLVLPAFLEFLGLPIRVRFRRWLIGRRLGANDAGKQKKHAERTDRADDPGSHGSASPE